MDVLVQNESAIVGSFIEFDYPAANYHGVRLRWERRRLFVIAARDIVSDQLELEAIQLDPLLRRGRILVTGIDCDKELERTFYRESMNNLRLLTLAEAV